ncbi:MAG: DMT family transporter [Pseudomonadota bacterium]
MFGGTARLMPLPETIVTRTHLILFVFVFLWATGFIGAALSMPHAEPMSFLALRFGIVAVLFGAITMMTGTTWPRGLDLIHPIVAGALIHGLYLGGVFWAIDKGLPSALSAMIVGFNPLIVALFAGAFLGERVTLRVWLALFAGFGGLMMVLSPGLYDVGTGINPANIAASIVSVVALSLGTIYQKRFATTIDLKSATALQYVGAFLPVFAMALFSETFAFNWTGELIFALLWLIFALSFLAVLLLMILIRDGEVSKISSYFFLVPGVSAVLAWWLFGDTLNLIQMLGMVICAVAVAIAVRQPASGSA